MTLGIVVFGAAFLVGLGLGTYTRRPFSTAFFVLGCFTALLMVAATGEALGAAAVLVIVLCSASSPRACGRRLRCSSAATSSSSHHRRRRRERRGREAAAFRVFARRVSRERFAMLAQHLAPAGVAELADATGFEVPLGREARRFESSRPQ